MATPTPPCPTYSHSSTFAFFQALALAGKGEYERALALLHEVVATCERFGEHFFQGRMLNTLGWIYGELQDFDRAIEWNQRSLQAARGWSPRQPDVEANALANLADDFIALGRLDEAEERLREIAKMVEEKVPKDCSISWRHTLRDYATFADLWLARGDWEQALSAADECLALAERTESAKYIVRARRARGQALPGSGQARRGRGGDPRGAATRGGGRQPAAALAHARRPGRSAAGTGPSRRRASRVRGRARRHRRGRCRSLGLPPAGHFPALGARAGHQAGGGGGSGGRELKRALSAGLRWISREAGFQARLCLQLRRRTCS